LGKPGTGKTTVVLQCIAKAHAKGANILLALPTAQLASRMRMKIRSTVEDAQDIDIDTCHAAFKLFEEEVESLPLMTMYDLVVLDEISLLDNLNSNALFASGWLQKRFRL
jgi:DNA replication protein DnaC